MANNPEPIVVINGMKFRDVTNKTTAGPVYNRREAEALSKGKHIVSDS